MPVEVNLQLSGNVNHIEMCWQTAEAVLSQVPFIEDPVQNRYNLLLALQEAVTNVLKHGYGSPTSSGFLEIRLSYDDADLEIEIRDDAPAFNPTHVSEMKDPTLAEDLPEGGYGVHIIRSVVDRLEYRRDAGQNVLTLAKCFAPVRVGVAVGSAL